MDPAGSPGRLRSATVVLGVAGGIAAYKAAELTRRLVEAGAHVCPVLTESAERFVGAATLSALASEPVRTSLFEEPEPIPHTSLGQRADLVIVAPATARVIAAYAAGLSSDLLVATLLATRAPVLVCPAMHTEMWEHPAVRENLATLRRRGVHVLEPDTGRLAGGDVGAGRLPDTARILEAAEAALAAEAGRRDLAGLRLLVTAGGTREPVDAVRYLSNRSSGKQGRAIALAAAERGAEVVLVSTVPAEPGPRLEVVPVETAEEMAAAVAARAAGADVVVMAAAVADFRPKAPAATKLKKRDGVPEIVLEPTPDILAGLGAAKRPGQVLVGFAAETGDVVAEARRKLESKGADLLVGNDVSAHEVGFGWDTNAVTIVSRTAAVEVPLSSKREIAEAVLDAALAELRAARGGPPGPQGEPQT